MITIDCPHCHLYHSPDLDCRTENMEGRWWLVKPPVDDPVPIVNQEIDKPEPIFGTIRLKRKYERKAK